METLRSLLVAWIGFCETLPIALQLPAMFAPILVPFVVITVIGLYLEYRRR